MSVDASDAGVVVLDRGRPEDTRRAVASCLAQAPRPRVLVVENGAEPPGQLPAGVECLVLGRNLGFAGGMNAGTARLLALGCRSVLLLNNDATLEPGCLARLCQALEGRAAVGPVVVRASDDRVESRGASLDPVWGRFRLTGHGEEPESVDRVDNVPALSGVALLVGAEAFERCGPLDESYFHGWEDVDWCLRAGALGLELGVARDTFARHVGGQTLGPDCADRFYYAARNHLMAMRRHRPVRGLHRPLRWGAIVTLHLLHAWGSRSVPRLAGLAAVAAGAGDDLRGRSGPRLKRAA